MPKTCVYPLLSTIGAINLFRQAFGKLMRAPASSFVYAEAGDAPAWLTKDELPPEVEPQLFRHALYFGSSFTYVALSKKFKATALGY